MKGPFRILAAGLILLFCSFALSGCSAESRKARRLDQAKHFLDAGDYDSAEVEYMNVLKMEPGNAEAIARLGIIYFDQGRMGRVLPYLNRAKEIQPDNLEVRLRLGKFFMALGRFEDARNEALFVLQRQPELEEAPILFAGSAVKPAEIEDSRRRLQSLPPALLNTAPVVVALGSLDLRQGKSKEAEAAFKRAETIAPKSGVVQSSIGAMYWSQNDLPAADRAFALAAEQSPPRSTRRLQYGQFKLRINDIAGARTVFERLIKETPDFLPALMGLAEVASKEAEILSKEKDATKAPAKYAEASAALEKVLSRDPLHPDAMLMNARILLAKNDPAKSILELDKMLRTYPQSAPAHHLLGNAQAAAGDTEKAMASFRQALTYAPGFIDAALALAGLNIRKGEFAAALVPLRAIVQQRPDIAPARLLLADAYRGLGNLNDALAIYRQMSEANPTSPETPMLMGMVLLQQSQWALAREAFAKALQAAPGYLPAVEQLVTLDLRENKPQAAIARVEELIAKDPKAGGAHLLLAKIFLLQKETAKAEASLLKAIEVDPDAPMPYFVLAKLYVDAQEESKAMARLQSVLTKNPRDMAALMLIGTIQDNQKNYKTARETYEKLLAINPNSVLALNNLAYLYSEQFGELDKAQQLAQKARELRPSQAHTADTLGWVLYRKRQYARALILIQEAAEKETRSGAIQYHLGMAHYMLGEEESARAALTRAIDAKEEFVGIEDGRASLKMLELNVDTDAAQLRPILEKAIAARPDDTVALTRLGAVYERTGVLDKAAEAYEKALKSSPNSLKASLSLIRVYTARKETAKAFELAKNARKFAPDDANLTHVFGQLVYQSGDSPWATSLLQEASRKQTDLPEVWLDLGVASYSAGHVEEAESSIQRALQISANFPRAQEARTFLALIPASTGTDRSAGVSAQVDQALKENPTHAPALMALGRIQEQKGDRNAAKATYGKLLVRYPDFTPAKRQLVILYAADPGETDKAYELAVKAREAFPDDAELGKALGIILYRKKEYTRAASALQSSAEQRKSDAELMYYLGMAKRELKDNNGAKQALQSALDLKVNAELATEARRILAELK